CVRNCAVNGIAELMQPHIISIYPNPCFNQLTIDASHLSIQYDQATITIFSTLGEVALTENRFIQKAISIDVRSLVAGIYFVKVINSGRELVGKFMKE